MLPKIDPKNFKLELTRDNYSLIAIPPQMIVLVWEALKDELEKEPELWNIAHSIHSLHDHIDRGCIKVWGIIDVENKFKMFFFTVEEEYPMLKLLKVTWCSGTNLKQYLGVILFGLDVYCQRNNIDATLIDGREGWGPVIAPFGYSRVQTTFMKRVVSTRTN